MFKYTVVNLVNTLHRRYSPVWMMQTGDFVGTPPLLRRALNLASEKSGGGASEGIVVDIREASLMSNKLASSEPGM